MVVVVLKLTALVYINSANCKVVKDLFTSAKHNRRKWLYWFDKWLFLMLLHAFCGRLLYFLRFTGGRLKMMSRSVLTRTLQCELVNMKEQLKIIFTKHALRLRYITGWSKVHLDYVSWTIFLLCFIFCMQPHFKRY